MGNQSIRPCTCQLAHNKLKCDYQEIFRRRDTRKKNKTKTKKKAKRDAINKFSSENDVLFSYDTGKLGKRHSECYYQESNIRPSDYLFGCSTTEPQETRES